MLAQSLKLTILSTIALTSLGFGGESSDDKKAIEGTWSITYAFIDGKLATADELKKGEVVITAGKMTFREKGKTEKTDGNVWQIQMDPSMKPKTIDVRLTAHRLRPGGEAIEMVAEKRLGIYELKANDLKIALSKGIPVKKNAKNQNESDGSVTRPTSFEHGPDVVGFLILKRAEK